MRGGESGRAGETSWWYRLANGSPDCNGCWLGADHRLAEARCGVFVSGFRVVERARSFGPALRGIWAMLRDEHNARIHAAATGAVVAAGIGFGLERGEWLAIAVATGLVWVAEAFNSAVEALGDAVSSEAHPLVGRAKDVAAGGVLLAAIGALVVAALVFGPRVF